MARKIQPGSESRLPSLRKKLILAFLIFAATAYILYLSGVRESMSPGQLEPNTYVAARRMNAVSQKKHCRHDLPVVYLKTHKTGSTTLKFVIFNYSWKHGVERIKESQYGEGPLVNASTRANAEFIRLPKPFSGGYPGSFRTVFVCHNNSLLCGPAGEASIPRLLWGHMRYDEEELEALMGKDARYITILRHPISQQESSFNYYYYNQHGDSFSMPTCMGEPYAEILQRPLRPRGNYSEYLRVVTKESLNKSVPYFFRSRNPQAYDLGLDPYNEDGECIQRKARELDSRFDLVLILDHMLESLLLLKETLCLEWKDITIRTRNKKTYEKHVYTSAETEKLRSMNKQDFLLFDYFNQSLWRKVEKYGRARMESDKARLQKLISDYEEENAKKLFESRPVRGNKTSKPRAARKHNHTRNISKKKQTHAPNYASNFGRDKPREYYIEKLRSQMVFNYPDANRTILHDLAGYMVENSGWCPDLNKNF